MAGNLTLDGVIHIEAAKDIHEDYFHHILSDIRYGRM